MGLSAGQLSRRLSQIPDTAWFSLFYLLSSFFIHTGKTNEFAVDSFPVRYCKKARIDRRKLFKEDEHLGFSRSERGFFCGLKVHMVVNALGQPIELLIRPAAQSDLRALSSMLLLLPGGASLYADGAYFSYEMERSLREEEGILLLSRRPKKSKGYRGDNIERWISSKRQVVETAFSSITRIFPRYLRANSERGFYLRLISILLAYCLTFLSEPSI